MNESDYWVRLEYRVCDELDGLRHTVARPYWCDGFIPSQHILNGYPPRIRGRVWMGVGPRGMEEWTFTLLLDRQYDSGEEIDWHALLPPLGVTKWLTVDPSVKQLTVEPSAAVPDG